jgi:hypothetical protein
MVTGTWQNKNNMGCSTGETPAMYVRSSLLRYLYRRLGPSAWAQLAGFKFLLTSSQICPLNVCHWCLCFDEEQAEPAQL